MTADFEGDNPQRRVGCLGTIVTTLLSSLFFVSNTGLLVWWVTRAVLSVPRPLVGFLPFADWGLPTVALYCQIRTIALASRVGMRRLGRLGSKLSLLVRAWPVVLGVVLDPWPQPTRGPRSHSFVGPYRLEQFGNVLAVADAQRFALVRIEAGDDRCAVHGKSGKLPRAEEVGGFFKCWDWL